uniref:Uncharacterized protein n=1 Tax=Anguilla anguilla TaxID=7936 RepID=A0A0E9R9K1_ANGAN
MQKLHKWHYKYISHRSSLSEWGISN